MCTVASLLTAHAHRIARCRQDDNEEFVTPDEDGAVPVAPVQ